MQMRARILGIVGVTMAIVGLVLAYLLWLTSSPAAVQARAEGGSSAQLTLQTVASLGPRYDHPDWVSYLAQKSPGKWVQSTNLEVPAHSLVRVTIHQYDTATGLRNPYFAQVQGTVGRTMQVDGKTVETVPPSQPAHTFAVPELGIYVPLPGVSDDASNQCDAAPCSEAEAHRTITFTFRTKGRGKFRWQCFVPCAAGFVTGNGGPMQTFNYMTGTLTVV